jgi:hypothetical protein
VDAVMQVGRMAKGTFYVHFEELAALEAELGESLTEELDRRLQPPRLSAGHLLTRLATATTILLRDLARGPVPNSRKRHQKAMDDVGAERWRLPLRRLRTSEANGVAGPAMLWAYSST